MTDRYRPFTRETALPDHEQAMLLWERHCMLDNIREHSRVVCSVAMLITGWLGEAGVPLRRRAVKIGALLHDVAKTPCLTSRQRHDLEGGRILEEAGYPELAELVRLHVVLPPEHPLDEIMVVNYADKRVNHDQVVSLEERYAYIVERYGNGDPVLMARIGKGLDRMRQVEDLIFGHLRPGHTPEEVLLAWRDNPWENV